MQASSTLHELGHNLELWHGGMPPSWGRITKVNGQTVATSTYVEPNCKPNYLSSMSYLFQVHGLRDSNGVPTIGYSTQKNTDVNETSLFDGYQTLEGAANSLRTAWFVP